MPIDCPHVQCMMACMSMPKSWWQGTLTHNSWLAMRARCYKPTSNGYGNYGGRGIVVCKRWLGNTAGYSKCPEGFAAFLLDMGERPSKSHSLERRDVNGNYEPSNCYWATPEEQYNNLRRSVRVTALGKTLTVSQWSRRAGLTAGTISDRLSRGWTEERAVTEPSRGSGTSEVQEASVALGLSRFSIYDRMRKGWTREEALSTPRCDAKKQEG
jgi:hypothetical protein